MGAALGAVLDSTPAPNNEEAVGQEQYQIHVLQNIANAARAAKTNLMHDLEERKKNISRIRIISISEKEDGE